MNVSLPCGLVIEANAPLSSLTSWGVGGRADHLTQPRTIDELREALTWGLLAGLPITILGGGTNVLVSDRGVRGLTIALRKLSGVTLEERESSNANTSANTNDASRSKRLHLDCMAGTSKSELLRIFLKHKLRPALFLAGLPGDVGGGVVMNAGVGEMIHPREFVEITEWIEVLRWDANALTDTSVSEVARGGALRLERLQATKLQWSYRHCEGWRPGVITRVGISWPLEPVPDILDQVKRANQARLAKQPLDLPSCGSVFVNPPGHKSGQLIERAGLKGFAIGGAKVSEKHANFIVNFNGAKASDIDLLIRHVRKTVREMSGVDLHTEVVYLGEW